MIAVIATVVYFALLFYFLLMWARFILDLAQMFSRGWRPRGVLLVLAEVAYSLTDPPIKAVRRVIPPIRVGGAALDFAWSIVMLVVIVLMYVALALQ